MPFPVLDGTFSPKSANPKQARLVYGCHGLAGRALGRLKEYVLWGRFQQFLRNEPIVNLP